MPKKSRSEVSFDSIGESGSIPGSLNSSGSPSSRKTGSKYSASETGSEVTATTRTGSGYTGGSSRSVISCPRGFAPLHASPPWHPDLPRTVLI